MSFILALSSQNGASKTPAGANADYIGQMARDKKHFAGTIGACNVHCLYHCLQCQVSFDDQIGAHAITGL